MFLTKNLKGAIDESVAGEREVTRLLEEKRKGWTKLGKTGRHPSGPGSLELGECETSPQEVGGFWERCGKEGT